NQAGKDRQAGGIGGRPAVGTAVVRVQGEERARAREPLCEARIVVDVVELVEITVWAVDHERLPVLAALLDVARRPALDPMGLCDRLRGKRIEGNAFACRIVDTVALVPVAERHGELRLRSVDDGIGHAVDVHASRRYLAAEVGMKMPGAAVV